jgi:uncharacterized membrane protein YeaQ/YmgE (transglycosylase-associated protein family)
MSWLLYVIIVGAVIGWLAGLLMKGGGFGLIGNVVIGILGSAIGGWVFNTFGLSGGDGLLGTIIVGVIGASILMFVVKLIRKA